MSGPLFLPALPPIRRSCRALNFAVKIRLSVIAIDNSHTDSDSLCYLSTQGCSSFSLLLSPPSVSKLSFKEPLLQVNYRRHLPTELENVSLLYAPPSPSLCLSSSSIPIPPFVAIVNINNTNNHRQCRTFSKNEGHHSILSLLAPHHTPSPFGEPATAPERAPNPEKPRWMHTTEMTLISPPPGFRSCASFNLSV